MSSLTVSVFLSPHAAIPKADAASKKAEKMRVIPFFMIFLLKR